MARGIAGSELLGLMPAAAYVLGSTAPNTLVDAAKAAQAHYGSRIGICSGADDDLHVLAALNLCDYGDTVLLLGPNFYFGARNLVINKCTVKANGASKFGGGTDIQLTTGFGIRATATGGFHDCLVTLPSGYVNNADLEGAVCVWPEVGGVGGTPYKLDQRIKPLSNIWVNCPAEPVTPTGTGIIFKADSTAASNFIELCHIGPIGASWGAKGLHVSANEPGAFNAWINGLIFESVILTANIKMLVLESKGGAGCEVNGNTFLALMLNYASHSTHGIHMTGVGKVHDNDIHLKSFDKPAGCREVVTDATGDGHPYYNRINGWWQSQTGTVSTLAPANHYVNIDLAECNVLTVGRHGQFRTLTEALTYRTGSLTGHVVIVAQNDTVEPSFIDWVDNTDLIGQGSTFAVDGVTYRALKLDGIQNSVLRDCTFTMTGGSDPNYALEVRGNTDRTCRLIDILFKNLRTGKNNSWGAYIYEAAAPDLVNVDFDTTVCDGDYCFGLKLDGTGAVRFKDCRFLTETSWGSRALYIGNTAIGANVFEFDHCYFNGGGGVQSSVEAESAVALAKLRNCTFIGPIVNIVSLNRGTIVPGESRSVSGPLVAGAVNAFTFAWQNPEVVAVLVTRVLVDVTTAGGTATAVLDVGSAANATTHSDNLIDGANLNAIALYDNLGDPGINGKPKQKLDANGGATDYITGQILVEAAASLAGKYYITYVGIG